MDAEGYIQRLSAEGQAAAGRIVVDLERALALTAHLSFPDGDGWVLKFVQAAVAAGAREIHLGFEEDQWLLRHDGASVRKLNFLDALGKEGPRKQMALCLRWAWQEPAQEVTLITHYEGRCAVLTLPGRGEWEPLAECPWGTEEGTLLMCRWRSPQTLTPQRIRRFREATRLAPARIWLERDCVNDPVEGDRRVPGRFWSSPDWHPRTLAVAPLNRELLDEQAQPVRSQDLNWRSLRAEMKALPALTFQTLTAEVAVHWLRLVHFGVEIEPFQEPLAGATTGLLSLLSTQGLVLDPVGWKVMDDPAFQARREQLRQSYPALFQAFQRSAPHTNIVRLFKGY